MPVKKAFEKYTRLLIITYFNKNKGKYVDYHVKQLLLLPYCN